MSYEPQADWERFREILQKYSEQMLALFPKASKENWLIICYQSFDDFVKRFPSPEIRDTIIERLEKIRMEIENALEACRTMFNAMSSKRQKKQGTFPSRRRVLMTRWEKFKHGLYLFVHYGLAGGLRNIRRRIWNKRIKLWWYRLFVRRNEFHPSLSTDVEAMIVMNDEELRKYHEDLAKRRAIAHSRDISRSGR